MIDILKLEVSEILKKTPINYVARYKFLGNDKKIEPLSGGLLFKTLLLVYKEQGKEALLKVFEYAKEKEKGKK